MTTTTKTAPKIPATLQPHQVVAIRDSREQLPWNLSPLAMVEGSLQTGDYSFRGGEQLCRIERKRLDDLLACVGRERERFEREIERLLAFPARCLIIESDWPEIEAGEYRSKVSPKAVAGSILAWTSLGLPVMLAGNRQRAQDLAARFLFLTARRLWRNGRDLIAFTIGAEVEVEE